jgi:lactoylglutathione lyase
MSLRLELFVTDLSTSTRFYTGVLGSQLRRRADDYVSLSRGAVVLGLGPVDKLPKRGSEPGFTQDRLHCDKTGGVEIVLELDRRADPSALHDHCQAHAVVVESLQLWPWGLYDFRLVDPDGYYLRFTDGNAAASATF